MKDRAPLNPGHFEAPAMSPTSMYGSTGTDEEEYRFSDFLEIRNLVKVFTIQKLNGEPE